MGERVLRSAVVVNAAGAWADEVARMAGVQPVGLQPYRRTVFTFASRFDSAGWPLVVGADESFYFKPEGADQLLASPADETPEPPRDVKPQEIDVAAGIDAINRATTLDVRSIRSTWAGLRTFAGDGVPVESDDAAAARATIFVDTAAGALLSGDLAQPLADGVITEASITADLRALATGDHPGRTTAEEITLFKSAGFAAADLAAARLALG